jgi:hypothetical protein
MRGTIARRATGNLDSDFAITLHKHRKQGCSD